MNHATVLFPIRQGIGPHHCSPQSWHHTQAEMRKEGVPSFTFAIGKVVQVQEDGGGAELAIMVIIEVLVRGIAYYDKTLQFLHWQTNQGCQSVFYAFHDGCLRGSQHAGRRGSSLTLPCLNPGWGSVRLSVAVLHTNQRSSELALCQGEEMATFDWTQKTGNQGDFRIFMNDVSLESLGCSSFDIHLRQTATCLLQDLLCIHYSQGFAWRQHFDLRHVGGPERSASSRRRSLARRQRATPEEVLYESREAKTLCVWSVVYKRQQRQ
mmetsp:Transcript_3562/g.8267  ORF Transcript_3562/g.8267 Transcript_3562/m.8267 type:complete len:266 (+) Transcript_3562:199-996(+)